MQRNHDWYNKNEARSWPLDDSATLVDDDGRFLPSNILADLHLWFPDRIGFRAYVSAVTVSPTLVTLVILSDGGSSPIATVSLVQPVVPYRQYALESQSPGAGGWVVFGSRVNDVTATESFRFSNPEQGLLLSRTAQCYTEFPVTGVAKVNTEPKLKGIVNLRGGHDVETFMAKRDLNGDLVMHTVAVVRLVDKTSGTTDRNIDEIYVGPCGPRPESVNCGDPQPIEFINEVPPDCCGRIYVEFRGCAELFNITNMKGIIVDCGFGLGEACAKDSHLPDDRGRLPNEYPDLCDLGGASSLSVMAIESASEDFREIVSLMQTDVIATPTGLPYQETFSNGAAPEFTVESGEFRFQQRSMISGTGHGGTIFFMSFVGDNKCYMKFGEEHGLNVGDQFVSVHILDGKRLLMEHNVEAIENDVALFTIPSPVTTTTKKPTHGVWVKLTGFDIGPSGGGFGVIDRVYPANKGSWYEADDINMLAINDRVVMLGSDDDHYNTIQEVTFVSGPDFGTDLPSREPAGRAAWVAAVPRGGGAISGIRNQGYGELRITCPAEHGLVTGDCVVIMPSRQKEYLRLYEVRRSLSPVDFTINGYYTTDDIGAWYLVRAYHRQETVYESDPYARSVSLWTGDPTRQPNWTCFHKQIAVTMRFKPMGAVYRMNGGVLFNYQQEGNGRSFVLLELDNDSGKLLRLWQSKNNNWTLWDQQYIPDFDVNMPYRLTLDVLPYSDKATDAFVIARLDGFEQESQYQLKPIRIPQFAPSTGLIGLHTNRSCVQFNNFSVSHLD